MTLPETACSHLRRTTTSKVAGLGHRSGAVKYSPPMVSDELWPLPEDSVLRNVALTLERQGQMAIVFDEHFEVVFVTSAHRRALGGGEMTPVGEVRSNLFGTTSMQDWIDDETLDLNRGTYLRAGGFMLADLPGGKDELRRRFSPPLAPLVDEVEVDDGVILDMQIRMPTGGGSVTSEGTFYRLRSKEGDTQGTIMISRPSGDAFMQSQMIGLIDPDNVVRLQATLAAERRPAAILCADLEGSTPLSSRMSTANYFRLTRRLVRSFDDCVLAEGGLVGRHAGDGVTAFFLAESAGSESKAARACIAAARSIAAAGVTIAEKSRIAPEELTVRFGLHWGSTLYVGAIQTRARFEVTAMGDQVNEAARIEACATGGRTLASKDLVELLDGVDANALGIDLDEVSYTPLGQLSTATHKALRDAATIPVCDV